MKIEYGYDDIDYSNPVEGFHKIKVKSPLMTLSLFNIIKHRIWLLIWILFLPSCTNTNEPTENSQIQFIGQISADLNIAIIKNDSSLWTFGPNISGQLGIGSFGGSEIPLKVYGLASNIVNIDLLEGIAVAADSKGDIWFWGDRLIWLEPPGRDTAILIPRKISYLPNVKIIDIVSSDVRLLCTDGSLWNITLDHNSPTKYLIPQQLINIGQVKHISENIILFKDGTLSEFANREPIKGGLLENITEVIDVDNVRNERTVVLKKDGTVWAWGQNQYGQLGNGKYTDSDTIQRVIGLSDIIDISSRYGYNLALKTDGSVWYWGVIGRDENNNTYGNPIPQRIDGLENVGYIMAYAVYYFIKNDNTFWKYNPADRNLEEIAF